MYETEVPFLRETLHGARRQFHYSRALRGALPPRVTAESSVCVANPPSPCRRYISVQVVSCPTPDELIKMLQYLKVATLSPI
jgi:hypothetical protein